MARSRNHCCHGDEAVRSHCNCSWHRRRCQHTKLFIAATKIQQWALSALLLSYKIFRTDVNNNKSKDKGHPRTGHEGPKGEYRYEYSSTLSLTSALDGVGGQRHTAAALPPEKTRYPLYKKLGGPQGQSGRTRKISPPTGIRSPDRPVRSESLYRLSYPGPFNNSKYLLLSVCVCILVLVTQNAMRMRRVISPSVACLAVQYFSTLSHKRRGFRGKKSY